MDDALSHGPTDLTEAMARRLRGGFYMRNAKISLRSLLTGFAFAAAMAFGATQAIATDMDDPGTR